ncbi:MAG: isoquinoline 1-oxidoreductase subunit beta [Alphaproteobacteria bacterium]|nr:isoquinoline 1-oxidoreductase subunit beta [Alphaproteobacteria bacterium]
MNQPINRRDFLKDTAAGLTFALTLAADPRAILAEAAAADGAFSPTVWVSIATDGAITIVSPAAEMGQGTFTTLPAILAEELDADWSKVKLVIPPAWEEKKYGNPVYGGSFQTSASASVHGYFKSLRVAGAQARRVLLDAVAAKWNVPVAELTTEPSVVVHKASGRRMSYGEVAGFAQAPAELPKIEDKDLKAAANFRLIGKDVARVELPTKVTGAAKYAMDVQVPGMVYAAVLQSPYPGGAPQTVDDTAARKVAGITDVLRLPDGVAVIGASVEGTQAAKNLLKVTWSDAPGASHDSERALGELAAAGRDKSRDGVPYETVGDAKAAMKSAAKVFTGEYRTRYVYHAQMEPLNATASVGADGKSAEIWAGTQGPTGLLNQVAQLLQTDRAKITLHQHVLGGGFGRRGQHEVVIDAVRLSKAVGKPVKLVWSREDDLMFGKFRPATAHHIEGGFDADGKLIAWHHRVIAESVVAYTAAMAGTTPAPIDRIVMKGSPIPQYPIANKLAEHVVMPGRARLAPWRGVGNGHNAFAAESFLDEMAKELGKDPIAFRLELSEGQPRMQHLLRTVAQMSDWTRKRDGTALGTATMVKDDTLAAGVAEVSVDRASGKIKVHNVWCAIDAGIAVQPRNLAAQTEGSIVYGLGHVLREKITIKDGRVQQSNFTDYEVTRMSDVPNIEVKVVSTDNPPTGAGEDGLPLVACAVGNAIAALTGVRLRELPFAPDRVRGALGA